MTRLMLTRLSAITPRPTQRLIPVSPLYRLRLSPCRRLTTLMRFSQPVRHFWPLRNQRFFCSRLRSGLLVERLGMQTRLTPLATQPSRSEPLFLPYLGHSPFIGMCQASAGSRPAQSLRWVSIHWCPFSPICKSSGSAAAEKLDVNPLLLLADCGLCSRPSGPSVRLDFLWIAIPRQRCEFLSRRGTEQTLERPSRCLC